MREENGVAAWDHTGEDLALPSCPLGTASWVTVAEDCKAKGRYWQEVEGEEERRTNWGLPSPSIFTEYSSCFSLPFSSASHPRR